MSHVLLGLFVRKLETSLIQSVIMIMLTKMVSLLEHCLVPKKSQFYVRCERKAKKLLRTEKIKGILLRLLLSNFQMDQTVQI